MFLLTIPAYLFARLGKKRIRIKTFVNAVVRLEEEPSKLRVRINIIRITLENDFILLVTLTCMTQVRKRLRLYLHLP